MKISAKYLKEQYEKMPDSVKMLTAPIFHAGLIKNPIFCKQYNELVRAENMSELQLNELQFQKLKELCVYAYENTVYYHRIFDDVKFNCYTFEDVAEFSEKLPIISKKDVLEHYDEINVSSIHDDYPAVTSGSSGTRLVINNSKECFYRENAFICHFYKQFGVGGGQAKIAYIGGDGKALITVSPLYNMLRCCSRFLNKDTVAEALQSICKYRPTIIRGLPSAIYWFCKLLDELNMRIDFPLRGVVFASENVFPYQRDLIERVLDCKSLAYYGQTERVVFAEEQFGNGEIPQYTFHKLYGYTEIDPDDDFAIIGTGFINRKMPLLRYKIDDRAELLSNGCYHITGHRSLAMIGKNGERISPASLSDTAAVFDLIDKFQFVQNKPGEVWVDLVPKRKLSEDEITAIRGALDDKFSGNMEFKLRFVKEVQLTERGKYSMLIQNCKV